MKTGLKYIIAYFFVFSMTLCYGQINVDSMIRLSNTASSDTERVNLLNKVCGEMYHNDYLKSEEYAYKALELAQKANFKRGVIESYKSIGNILCNKGDYKPAIENFLNALKLSESINDRMNMGKILHNIAGVYNELDIYDKALNNYLKAIEIYKPLDYQKGIARSYSGIGIVYDKMNKHEQAIDYFQKSLDIYKKLNYSNGIGKAYMYIGQSFSIMGKYQDALSNYSEAIKIFNDTKDFNDVALVKLLNSEVYFKTGDLKQAEKNVLSSLELSKQIGFQESIKGCYKTLTDIYEKSNNYIKAFQYQKLYMQKKDSINNSDVSLKISAMQKNYEQEKKDKAVALKNQERELKQQAEIDSQKTTKTYLIIGLILLLILAGVIFDKYRVKNKSNISLAEKNREIAEKNKEITDSINYAKRIQDAILPPAPLMKKLLPNSFIFYKPKDIVSGDFYWTEKIKNKTLFAVADCTGHGVSGSMMSILCSNLLTDARNKGIDSPSEILDHVNRQICRNLHQTSGEETIKDGMDIAICALNNETLELEYAGAFNPLFIIRNGEIIELKADKMPINENRTLLYNNNRIFLKKEDNVFLFTDGYADQFGGDKGKKLKYKPFGEILKRISTLSSSNKKLTYLETEFHNWQRGYEQTDDVLVMGIEI